ncbi:MAG: hypothetical protein AAFV25_11235, partial [Bacteroidota bacterium]
MYKHLLIAFSALLFFVLPAKADTFQAVSNGNWTDGSVWDQGTAPGPGDSVYIDGHSITFNTSSTEIQYLALSNASGSGETVLMVSGSVMLSVAGNMDVSSEDSSNGFTVEISGTAQLSVGGSLTVTRAANDDTNKELAFDIFNSGRLTVSGDLTFDYDNDSFTKGNTKIDLNQDGQLMVSGTVRADLQGGGNFHWHFKGNSSFIGGSNVDIKRKGSKKVHLHFDTEGHSTVSGNMTLEDFAGNSKTHLHVGTGQGKLTIAGNLTIDSKTANQIMEVEVRGVSAFLSVRGDILLDAQSEGDVLIEIAQEARLEVGSNISRTLYGSLTMESGTSLIYNGNGAQTLACNNVPGSGADEFVFADIFIENNSGLPISLEDTLFVEVDMDLTQGILKTTTAAPLIVGDQASLSGGNATSYIDGPVIKQGRSTGNFVFPLGDSTTYAPIELTEITDAASTYSLQYFNCPPPFGNLSAGVSEVSQAEFWLMEWSSTSSLFDVTLYWEDAIRSGIGNEDSLIVVYKTPTGDWTSMDRQSLQTTANSGSLSSNALNCPPPFGQLYITFGSTSPQFTSLPAELIRFDAKRLNNSKVSLEWETASEINFSHFEIERSADGTNFQTLARVASKGDFMTAASYGYTDVLPLGGVNYYRLKQVDTNGTFLYSDIRLLPFPMDASISVYPNPTAEFLYIRGLNPDAKMGQVEV